MNDYRFWVAVLAQKEVPSLSDLPALLEAVEGFCDEVIRSHTEATDIDYTASQLIAVVSQFKAWSVLNEDDDNGEPSGEDDIGQPLRPEDYGYYFTGI